jgi:hypothetical protein
MTREAGRQFSLAADPILLEVVEAVPSARQAWRYTARPGWSSPGESLWMRLSKFSLCNRLSSAELTELFALRDADGLYMAVDLRRKERWDEAALGIILELAPGVLAMSFCVTQPRQVLGRVSTELRYCKQCLQTGFHAAWFQWLSAERCPVHREFLRSGCLNCSAPIPYAVEGGLAVSPLRCPTCTHDWVPSLSRPGGSCDPIDAACATLMQNWAEYVNDAGSRERCVRRDHQTGQYLVDRSLASNSAATRPNFVTMVNRLFETPPPSLMQVSAAYAADRESRVLPPVIDPRLSRCGAHKACFEVRLWPHFTGDFVVFERLVHDMRHQVFGSQGLGLQGAQAARLLLGGMVVESATLGVNEAAAIGWSVSWLGQSRTFAPSSELLLPATGLTAWLATLPIRSAAISATDWRSQVQRWLTHDLALSATLWLEVARFMSGCGTYLLRGEAVSTIALALRHHEHGK